MILIKKKNILLEHKKELFALAEELLRKEVIVKEDLELILGKRKPNLQKELAEVI